MIPAPIGSNEAARLATLQHYQILDTPAEAEFDDITALAAKICAMPMSLMSVIDARRQWFKSAFGVTISETPRDISFCGHTIHQTDVLEIPDLTLDARFHDNPVVTGVDGIRFYAGMPLIAPDGNAIGTLSVVDRVPRKLNDMQRDALATLARQLVRQLELRLGARVLRESEERYRDLVEGTSDLIQSVAADGSLLFANRAWCQALGYEGQELAGLNLFDIVEPDHRAECAAMMATLISGASLGLVQIPLQAKSGGVVYLEGRITARMGDGRMMATRGIFRDISARKRADNSLRDITNSVPGAIYQFQWLPDAIPEVHFMSAGIKALVGVDANTAQQDLQVVFDLIHEEDRGGFFASLHEVIMKGKRTWTHECRVRRLDGQIRWTRSRANARGSGEDLVWSGYWVDITERREETEMRMVERNRLDLALSNTGSATWDADLRNDIVSLDARWSEILGGEPVASIVPMASVVSLLSPEDQERLRRVAIETLTGRTELYAIEHQIKARNGEWRWVEVHGKVVERDENGRAVRAIGIARDISRRKSVEQSLLAAKTAAEQANAAKDMFLATMSHEIRTPLNGLVGMLELMTHTPLNTSQQETLSIARDSGWALRRIIDDILDHAKIEAGKMEIVPEPVALGPLLQRIANTYFAVAKSRGLAIRTYADPRLSAAHMADPLRLLQVLGNLVSNAVKFTESGNIEMRADFVSRDKVSGNETIVLSVVDTGIGMSEEAQGRLFVPFEQASTGTTRLYGGTGLGLSIIRRLVELMQGSITIDSAVGRGTTMRVELTLAISEQSPSGHADFALPAVTPQAAPADVALPAAAKLATKKINDSLQVLAVDDNPVNRMLLERQLALLGMRVETAEDGQEAFEKWRDGNFDMIVSDIHMPGMDGYGLARAVRLREAEHSLPRIPMLAWSASVLTDTYDNCILAGMDDLLLKPATLAQLKVAIAKWLPEAIPQALQKA